MDFKPTHMIDMLKVARTLSRTTWLALTRGGAQTTIACEVTKGANEHVARVVVETQEYVFGAPADALVEIPSTPTIAREDEPTRRLPMTGAPKPVEHAPLPRKRQPDTLPAPPEPQDAPQSPDAPADGPSTP